MIEKGNIQEGRNSQLNVPTLLVVVEGLEKSLILGLS